MIWWYYTYRWVWFLISVYDFVSFVLTVKAAFLFLLWSCTNNLVYFKLSFECFYCIACFTELFLLVFKKKYYSTLLTSLSFGFLWKLFYWHDTTPINFILTNLMWNIKMEYSRLFNMWGVCICQQNIHYFINFYCFIIQRNRYHTISHSKCCLQRWYHVSFKQTFSNACPPWFYDTNTGSI